MSAPRWFVLTGGRDADHVHERASEHGEPVRTVAYQAPSGNAYAVVEVARPAVVRDGEVNE